jgi:hypothetical protein
VYAGRIDGGVKMWQDPIVDEVRRVRLEIEKECEDDFARIYERALDVQKKVGDKLVSGLVEKKQEDRSAVEV